jgi:hypothetical protein
MPRPQASKRTRTPPAAAGKNGSTIPAPPAPDPVDPSHAIPGKPGFALPRFHASGVAGPVPGGAGNTGSGMRDDADDALNNAPQDGSQNGAPDGPQNGLRGLPQNGRQDGPQKRRAPALRALLIQAVAFLLVLAVVRSVASLSGFTLPALPAALLQGALAALVSRRRLARWWMPIQLLFAPALVLTQALAFSWQLPPSVFLLVFAVMLALFWSTFRTQVPYYPSGATTWDSVAGLLPAQPQRFIDIGSGFGGLALALARRRPDCRCEGIEVAPLPWFVSHLRALRTRLRHGVVTRFLRGDYYRLDLGDYDMVFAYLSPAAMPALWAKARAEMAPGSLLLSCEFPVPDIAPDIVIDHAGGVPTLYGWRM